MTSFIILLFIMHFIFLLLYQIIQNQIIKYHQKSAKLYNFQFMSLSPQKLKIIKQRQYQNQIERTSPTKNDVNFYVRKTLRLEDQLSVLQDQLGNAKLRLRKAEDYQIKYDLVVKQNNNLNSENQKLLKQIQNLKVEIQKKNLKSQEDTGIKDDFSKQRAQLLSEIQKWKMKFNDIQQKKILDQKKQIVVMSNINKQQYEVIKKQFIQRQERFENEIRQLKRIIAQKQTVQNVIGGKVQRIKKQKDEQTMRLNNLIEKERKQFEEILLEKKQQLQSLQNKYQKIVGYQIQNIKLNLDDQDELFKIELNGLRQIITLKNDEISKLLDSLKKQSYKYQSQIDLLKNDIKQLKDSIYKNQRINQLELYNVKQRLTKIHASEIQSLEKKYKNFIEALNNQKIQSNKILKLKQEQLKNQFKEIQKIKRQTTQRIVEKDAKINQLKSRIDQIITSHTKQAHELHHSLHQIQSEKQTMIYNYQENINFLDQQVKILKSSLETKINQIKYLQNQITSLKKSNNQINKSLQQKWRLQKKERQNDRQIFRSQKQKIQTEQEQKFNQWKITEKSIRQQKQQLQREYNRLRFVLDELNKDNERLKGYIKQLDQSLKRQLKKNQLSTMDIGSIRRQLLGEFQKQKSQLQSVKRMQVDQICKTYEIENSKLSNQILRLETDLVNKTTAYQKLEQDYKKLEGINKNIEKISKEKIIQYQKKMATINSQINLTQNLYQSFIQAKSRMKKQS